MTKVELKGLSGEDMNVVDKELKVSNAMPHKIYKKEVLETRIYEPNVPVSV